MFGFGSALGAGGLMGRMMGQPQQGFLPQQGFMNGAVGATTNLAQQYMGMGNQPTQSVSNDLIRQLLTRARAGNYMNMAMPSMPNQQPILSQIGGGSVARTNDYRESDAKRADEYQRQYGGTRDNPYVPVENGGNPDWKPSYEPGSNYDTGIYNPGDWQNRSKPLPGY